ncbi:M20/M25/M40 family metallo-hydrolase [Ideonella sp. DXS29W]|uniref:M20/M25/M40 family metallo-hydrolase n=1 Tax=Ideonella lacteola TaxID=2984193 RepID=A0ABU9BTN1_9BURK
MGGNYMVRYMTTGTRAAHLEAIAGAHTAATAAKTTAALALAVTLACSGSAWARAADDGATSAPSIAAAAVDPDVLAARDGISQRRMSDVVLELTQPQYNGRLPGTPGDTLSRDWIVGEFSDIGLTPAGVEGYLQPFTTKITQPDGKTKGTPKNPLYGQKASSSNIIGIIPGNDPVLSKEVVIISGHRDHLGYDPSAIQYPGANDDLSGVAATLELARAFYKLKAKNKRTLMFVAYGAEEQAQMGSMHHVDHPVAAAPNKNIVFMTTIDMIGRGFDKWADFSQSQMDSYSNRWFREVYNGSNKDRDAYSHEYPKENGKTFDYDAGPFAKIGIHTRVFGLAEGIANYHKTTDTWEKVHFEPMVNVTRTIFDFIWKVDQDPRIHVKPLTATRPGARTGQ